jgi:hypothetical protein
MCSLHTSVASHTSDAQCHWLRTNYVELTVMQLLNKFHAIYRTQKFHYHVHKSLPMNPVPIKMNSVHTFTSDFFLVHLLLQRGLIPVWWLPNILYAFLIFSIVLHAASMLYSLEFLWFPELLCTWLCFVTCLCKGIWVPLFYGIG